MIRNKLFTTALVAFLCTSCKNNEMKPSEVSSLSAFEGVWHLACSANSRSNKKRAYMTSRDTLTANSLVSMTNFYSDAGCTLPGEPVSRLSKLSLSFPGGFTETQLGKAIHMNATLNVLEYDGVAITENIVESPYEFIGREFFDILLVKDNTLYYGAWSKARGGENASQRFKKLATAFPYKPQ